MLNKLRLLTLGGALIIGISSCAGSLPGANSEADAFSLLADDSAAASGHKHGKHRKHGKHGKHHGMMFKMMARGLNLTDAQKTEFKALMVSGKEDRQAMHDKMKEFKATVKTQFLSDSFDAAALQTQWQSLKGSDATSKHQKMAEKMVKAWAILTPEQQKKVEERMDKMANHMSDKKMGHHKKHGAKKLERMAKALDLTEAQQATLKTRWEANKAERTDRHATMKTVKADVFAKLKAGASAAELSAAMAPMMDSMHGKSSKYLNRLKNFHDVLTPEQRQKMVTLMEKRHGKKHRGHHGG